LAAARRRLAIAPRSIRLGQVFGPCCRYVRSGAHARRAWSEGCGGRLRCALFSASFAHAVAARLVCVPCSVVPPGSPAWMKSTDCSTIPQLVSIPAACGQREHVVRVAVVLTDCVTCAEGGFHELRLIQYHRRTGDFPCNAFQVPCAARVIRTIKHSCESAGGDYAARAALQHEPLMVGVKRFGLRGRQLCTPRRGQMTSAGLGPWSACSCNTPSQSEVFAAFASGPCRRQVRPA